MQLRITIQTHSDIISFRSNEMECTCTVVSDNEIRVSTRHLRKYLGNNSAGNL